MNIENILNKIYERDFFTDIILEKTVTSTNSLLKDMAKEQALEGTVLIAEEQTAGRGRLGRSFFSPQSSGVYFSILLRPQIEAKDSLLLTTAAAVACVKAIEKICDIKADIKWVNDIYIDSRKVSGILTEGSITAEGNLEYAIVGIGVNVYTPAEDFPADIKDIAGALYNSSKNKTNIISINDINDINDIKERLVAEILNFFVEYYHSLPQKEFLSEYKERSMLIGKNIQILNGTCSTPATVLGIDDDCHLIVQLKSGEIQNLSSGEVSVRLSK